MCAWCQLWLLPLLLLLLLLLLLPRCLSDLLLANKCNECVSWLWHVCVCLDSLSLSLPLCVFLSFTRSHLQPTTHCNVMAVGNVQLPGLALLFGQVWSHVIKVCCYGSVFLWVVVVMVVVMWARVVPSMRSCRGGPSSSLSHSFVGIYGSSVSSSRVLCLKGQRERGGKTEVIQMLALLLSCSCHCGICRLYQWFTSFFFCHL